MERRKPLWDKPKPENHAASTNNTMGKIEKKVSLFLLIGLIVFAIYSTVLVVRATANKVYKLDNTLSLMAGRFNQGKLSFCDDHCPGRFDVAEYNGKQYVYFGPLPSVLLMPFVYAFGESVPDLAIGPISLLIVFLAVYKIGRSFQFQAEDSVWLAVFFAFSTVFLAAIITGAAMQIMALGAALVLLSIVSYFSKRHALLTGAFVALAGLTRVTLFLALIFFVAELIRKKDDFKNLVYLFLPCVIALGLLGVYNYKRFDSFFETGYQYNTTLKTNPMAANAAHGFLSLSHVPANLYNLLIKSPDPLIQEGGGFVLRFPYLKANPWGMAIWYTSPLFLFILFKFRKSEYSLASAIAVLCLAQPALLYFGIGYVQFGYRYSLDFLPMLLLLLIPSFIPSVSWRAKLLITIGVIFNCIYMASIWGIYPHFGIRTG